MKRIHALLASFFRPGAQTVSLPSSLSIQPAGAVADAYALYGLFGLQANIDSIDWDLAAIVSSAATITLTGAQFYNNVISYSGAPAGGVTITTPTAAQIIAAMPSSIPTNGYNFPWFFINDNSGQTVTLAGGTNVTVVGNATIATNTNRHFVVSVNVGAGTVTIVNMGTVTL